MKKNLKYILSFVLILSAVGCKKSFLTLEPISSATSISFFKNTADITNAVTACYSPLQGGGMYIGNFLQLMECRSDNIEDQNPGGNAGREYNIDRFIAGSENTTIGDTWNALYSAIARCNNVLANLDVVTDATLKQRFEGEVRFLRALHYFNLVRLYGGVPVVLKPTSTQDALLIGRSPVNAVYAAIEDDLVKAGALLPVSNTAANLARPTAGSAKGLLGKVYLTEKKYTSAITVLKDLIPVGTNAYKYTLLPNIADVFSVTNKLNAEVLFAVHFDKTLAGQGHAYPIYINSPIFDPNLLNAYEATDTRRDLCNTVRIDANTLAMKKYTDSFDATNRTVGFDAIVLRYSDVLLMYSEALNEVAYSNDPNSDNFKYLNMVRSRAKASILTPAMLTNQASFRTAVLQERRLELPMEFSRWFDLIRTNTAIQALQNTALTKITIQEYQFLYPIPAGQIEVMRNPSIFPQNPGY